MFWSKIWLFLLALVAAGTLTVSLALPRSAHKSRVADERQRLVVACDVVNILLERKAITDVEVVGNFAREATLVAQLEQAGSAKELDGSRSPSKELTDLANSLMKKVDGSKPTYAVITDATGRVISRAGFEEGQVGDVIAGLPLVDDALAGYLRDDTWVTEDNALFLVAASPVVSRSSRDKDSKIIGATVLGWKLDRELADGFVAAFRASKPGDAAPAEGDADKKAEPKDAEDRSIHVAFYAGGAQVTSSSTPAQLKSEDVNAQFQRADRSLPVGKDCRAIAPFYASHDKDEYAAVMSRVPGTSEDAGAYFVAYTPRPMEASFGGAVSKASSELGGGFPWAMVIVLFVVGFGGGVALTIIESDRPLRRLQADAVKLAKAEVERLAEEAHKGRFGSIARSVNIQIDKLARDAKAAKKDLDQLLGPAPEGSLGAMDLLGPPPSRPAAGGGLAGLGLGAPATPAAPPPSQFKFGDSGSTKPAVAAAAPDLDLGPAPKAATPKPMPGTPPPKPSTPTPPPSKPAPPPPSPPKRLDDDILSFDEPAIEGPIGGASAPAAAPPAAAAAGEEEYFREIFEQFLELKKKCGESIAGLTFAKFGEKLRKNRADLMAKTGCTEVRFTVYVKDGKAALKATPVKET